MSAGAMGERLACASAEATAVRSAFAEGRAVDLDRLTEMVESVCRDLAGLRGAEATGLRLRLVALYDDLDRLAEALRREHDALKQSLGELGARQRARSAYRKASRDSG